MLHYTLYRLQLAHTVGECILQRGGSNALFSDDFFVNLHFSPFSGTFWIFIFVVDG